MQTLLYSCCGVDVHDNMIETCIIKGMGEQKEEIIRKQFSTMPSGLKAFTEHLMEHGCFNVAMESTGIYWRPVYEAIETYCPYYENIFVTNASHMRNIPGRKSDVADAEWIATLFQHGLLRSSFVPPKCFRNLREMSRLYKKAVGEKSRYVNRLSKFLNARGIKLASVLSDILCVTGRNLLKVLAHRGSLSVTEAEKAIRGNPKHSPEEIAAAVIVSLDESERGILNFIVGKIESIEAELSVLFESMESLAKPFQTAVDQMVSIPGIDRLAALLILAEIGAAPHENFDSPEKLCSWAGLSPRNDESAGKVKSRRIMPGNPYIKAILCQAAWAAVKSRNNQFREWFWCHQRKLGKKKAITAVSRKLLSTIYVMLRDGTYFRLDLKPKAPKAS